MDKILSISIAAYNVERYLAEALDSLACQLIDSLDIIVVNDGSKDGTSQIAHRYALKYPQSIRVIDKENGGYGSTHNASLSIAEGRYFKFLDGDDWFDSAVLETYISILNEVQADAIITPYVRVYEADGFTEVTVDDVPELSEGLHELSEIASCKPIAACSLTYRTNMLREQAFCMSEKMFYTDIEYAYLPWQGIRSFAVYKLPIYRYRLGRAGQSVSREGITAHYQDLCVVCGGLLDKLADNDGAAAEVAEYIKRCLISESLGVYYFLCKAFPSERVAKALAAWDSHLKKYAEISGEVERCGKIVRFLRMTNLHGYRIAAWVKGREI